MTNANYEMAASNAASAVSRAQNYLKFANDSCGTGMHVTTPAPPVPQSATGRVYLAGPILGLTYTECRFGWRQAVAMRLLPGITVLSPMRHEGHLAEHAGSIDDDVIGNATHFFAGSKIIFSKDVLDIRSCDILLANFLGVERPSLGTVSEIGMAYILNKTIITVVAPLNIHQHPFVLEPSALVLDNLDDAITAVNSLLSTGV